MSLLMEVFYQLTKTPSGLLFELLLRRPENLFENGLEQRSRLLHDSMAGLVCVSELAQTLTRCLVTTWSYKAI